MSARLLETWLPIAEDEVLRELSTPKRKPPERALLQEIRAAIDEARRLCRGKILYRILRVEEEGLRQERALDRLLAPAEEAAFMVASLDPALEDAERSARARGEHLRAAVLDAAGTAALRALSFCLEGELSARATELSLAVSPRFSPGSSGWELPSGHRLVFSFLDASRIGVSLTDSFRLLPGKSLSGVHGIGLYDPRLRPSSPCLRCLSVRCPSRRGEPFLTGAAS